MWKPQLFKRQFYSEILDATLTVTVTMRTLDLIDAAFGFDFYILKVPGAAGRAGLCPRCPRPWAGRHGVLEFRHGKP